MSAETGSFDFEGAEHLFTDLEVGLAEYVTFVDIQAEHRQRWQESGIYGTALDLAEATRASSRIPLRSPHSLLSSTLYATQGYDVQHDEPRDYTEVGIRFLSIYPLINGAYQVSRIHVAVGRFIHEGVESQMTEPTEAFTVEQATALWEDAQSLREMRAAGVLPNLNDELSAIDPGKPKQQATQDNPL